MSKHTVMDDWAHGLPHEVKVALSREIESKDNPAYGELSKEGGPGQAITSAAGFTVLTGWEEQGHAFQVNVLGTDQIKIVTEGVYQVTATLSMEVADLGQYEIALHVNGIIAHNIHTSRDYNPNKVGTSSLTGLVQLYEDDIIDLRVLVPADTTVTIAHASMLIVGLHQP